MGTRIKRLRKVPRWAKVALVVIVIITVIVSIIVGISYYAALSLVHPEREGLTSDPGDYNMTYTNISFRATDGVPLKGWYINGSGIRANITIILCHGYGHNRAQMLPYAEFLHSYGYSLFMFDFRAHGDSRGNMCTISYREVNDLLGAIGELKAMGHARFGVLGISMGAATAVRGAARSHDIKAVVADSCFSNGEELTKNAFTHFSGLPEWPFAPLTAHFMEGMIGVKASEISPERDATKLHDCALFVISGTEDEIAPVSNGLAVYNNAPGPKQKWLVNGAGHVEALEVDGAAYRMKVCGFFDRYLLTT